jgi:hypothetical protein
MVVGKIRLGEVHLGSNQELAIILMGRLHSLYYTKLCKYLQPQFSIKYDCFVCVSPIINL